MPSGTHHSGRPLAICVYPNATGCRLQLYEGDRGAEQTVAVSGGRPCFERVGQAVWFGGQTALLKHQQIRSLALAILFRMAHVVSPQAQSSLRPGFP